MLLSDEYPLEPEHRRQEIRQAQHAPSPRWTVYVEDDALFQGEKKNVSNKVSSKCQVYASRLSRQSMDRPSELA